jgi:biopolymer transport protein TolQ
MNVNVDLSLFQMVLNASLVVQLVMAALALVSMVSWTMIFDKARTLRRAAQAAEAFEKKFWSGIDLAQLYKQISTRSQNATGLEEIFRAGFGEFIRLRKQPSVEPMALVSGVQRGMRVAFTREIDALESYLSFLATVASTSPYVGLFGTVWGIMNAFRNLGASTQQATLTAVAPGIAEALIATAMGLFAAIPAVIAYNRYANDVQRLANRYEAFAEEFTTFLQRQAHLELAAASKT